MITYLDNQALQGLQDMLGDDLQEITGLYAATLDDEVQNLKGTLAAADWTLLNRQARSLKGSSANLGAVEMARLAAYIEKAALQADAPGIQAAVDQLDAVSAATVTAMREGGYLKG